MFREKIVSLCRLSLLLLAVISCLTQAKDKPCVKKLYGNDNTAKPCLDHYSFSKKIVEKKAGKEITLLEKIEKKSCYELALSNDSTCQSIGWSDDQMGSDYCWHPSGKDRLRVSALEKCEQQGCECAIVISSGKVVDNKLLQKFDLSFENSTLLANTQRSDKETHLLPPDKLAEQSDIGSSAKTKEKNSKLPRKEVAQQAHSEISIVSDMQVSYTQPDVEGDFVITINANRDTASLKINNDELGGRSDGKYVVKKIARAGQNTIFSIVARDINGNTLEKTITVNRPVVVSKASVAPLNPAQIKRQTDRDAVAIIIGIANYNSLPKAEFANDDARVFYDYAIRALGVKPEHIKLLVDSDAEDVEIIKTFKTWLPSRVKSTTDVYVYYSGHGLPTQDGQGLYLLPPRADRDLISRTAIQFQEINADLQAAKPKSVTIFMDACYSGQTRSGETLVANSRPVILKAEKKLFPDNFTVIAASQADQISSSSPDLKHGIFSYYLMKGMEGDADANKDGKITLGEMQAYLVENVGRQAGMMSRKQEPQLIGDASKLLVGR
jgi:hypothetical protein